MTGRVKTTTGSAGLVLIGGGLANSLIAHFLSELRPDLELLIIERGATLGGNHTWSFHSTDVSPDGLKRLAPLTMCSWPTQEVRFPGTVRQLATGYHSISSDRLHDVLMARLPGRIRLGTEIKAVSPTRVTLADGSEIAAGAVVDGRGYRHSNALELAFQKFVGVEYAFDAPHGADRPVIMDATVPQRDGYRFVYTLPFSPTRMLVEDTYYADGPELDDAAITELIEAYANDQGWPGRTVLRTERGILPIALAGDIDAFWAQAPRGVTQTGLRAALFHPTTGYSLPDAVRLAELFAAEASADADRLFDLVRRHSITTWNSRGMFRLLNRMLFKAAEPGQRRDVLARFYTLPRPLIERFYAGSLTGGDRLRILMGKPPVPLSRAIGQLVPFRRLAARRAAL